VGRVRSPLVLRFAAATLLLVIAAIHLNLYLGEEYNKIPTIGVLFLLTAISATLLAAALLVRPTWLFEASAGVFALGVLGSYLLCLLLPGGLFSFKEPGVAYSGAASIAAEAGTVVISALLIRRRAQRYRTLESSLTPVAS
jgi:hypothetical protein